MQDRRVCVFTAALLAVGAAAAAQTDPWLALERFDLQPGGQPTTTRSTVMNPAISDSGRWLVFSSTATDLVAGDTNGRSDIFMRDRDTGITRRLSLRPGGLQTTADSYAPAISADARFVTFVSADGQLVASDTNSVPDQFLLDRDSDGNGVFDEPATTTLERVSLNNAGAGFFNGVRNVVAAVSDHGTSATFVTLQSLTANDTNSKLDVYVRDRNASASRVLSQSDSGIVGNGDSPDFYAPPVRISGNGAVVAFSSDAGNLVAGDGNAAVDIFVRNRDSDGNGVLDEPGGATTVRANLDAGGNALPLGGFAQFDLSGDGGWLAYSHPDPGGSNPLGTDIALRNLTTGSFAPVAFVATQWAKGTASCCGNQAPRLSRRGEVVTFAATQLYTFGPGISGSRSDAFVKSRGRLLTRLTDFPPPVASTDGYSAGITALSRNGAYLVLAVIGVGAAAVPQEGYFVYQRDTVFYDDFEP